MLVELKNGETLNGHLVNCDTWMNLTLKEVVQTSPVCASTLPPLCVRAMPLVASALPISHAHDPTGASRRAV
jgi:small nuclear ribonucleoprotein (snRNP)-like protein